MGQNPNATTKIGSKMGGAHIPKWDPIGFEPWPFGQGPTEFGVADPPVSWNDRTLGNWAGSPDIGPAGLLDWHG